MITKTYLNQLTYKIIGAAIEVHKELGPGLMENVYEKCLVKELSLAGLKCTSQQQIQLNYKGLDLNCELRYDIKSKTLSLLN